MRSRRRGFVPAARALAMSTTLQGPINPWQLAAVAVAGLLVAVVGSILPARWAARTSIMNVLNL